MSKEINKKTIHTCTVDPVWRRQAEKLCSDFQLTCGEMIIVAFQPHKQLFACCTSNAREHMLKHFKTFKECLQFSQNQTADVKQADGVGQDGRCCLCFATSRKREMRECRKEDTEFVLDVEVPANSSMCGDCFNNVQKYHDFKKKVLEKQRLQKLKLKFKFLDQEKYADLKTTESGAVHISPKSSNTDQETQKVHNTRGRKLTTAAETVSPKKFITQISKPKAAQGIEKVNAVKDHKYVKKIQKEDKEMTHSFDTDDKEPDRRKHRRKQLSTNKYTINAKPKNAASSLLAKSLKHIPFQEIAAKAKKTDSEQGTHSKQILTKVPPILPKKHTNMTPAKSETAPLHVSSETVNQIREKISKSKPVKTEVVSESMFQLQERTTSDDDVTPVIISSTETTATHSSGLCKSGTAQTLTTPTFVKPVSSSRVSYGQMEKSQTVEGSQVHTVIDGQLGTSPNMNLMLVGAPNRYCLIQQPTDKNAVQLVANQLPVPQTNLLLTPSPLLPGGTTNSSMTQSGLVLVPASQMSLHTPYTPNTPTPFKRILPAAPPATQNKTPQTTQTDIASQVEAPAVPSHADMSVPVSTPPTTLPKVFILAAPNSMSSALKSNRTGFIVPASTTPNSAVTQTGLTSESPCVETGTSPDGQKTEKNSASQLLLSFIKKELQEPAIEDRQSDITDDKVDSSKEEVGDKHLPKSGNIEKPVVPPKQVEKSIKSETKGSFMKIGSVLYHFVVRGGQQYLVPIQQQALIPASTLPQKKQFLAATKLSSKNKRKHEVRKDLNADSMKRMKIASAPDVKTNMMMPNSESESDPEDVEPTKVIKPIIGIKQSDKIDDGDHDHPTKQQSHTASPETGTPAEEQAPVTNPQKDTNTDSTKTVIHPEHGYSSNSQPYPDVPQMQVNDHGYSVVLKDISAVRCNTCTFRSMYWKPMADHMRLHGAKRYCIKCNGFYPNRDFSNHNCARRAKTRKHICMICSRLADSVPDLFRHYADNHGTEVEKQSHCSSLYRAVRSQNVFSCRGCAAVEYSEQTMLIHVKKVHICARHENKDPHSHLLQKRDPTCVCPVCWFHFPEKEQLNYHLQTFHIIKSGDALECSLCDEQFDSIEELFDHYSTHKPNIKYQCGICIQYKEPMKSLEEVHNHRDSVHPTNNLLALLLCPKPLCQETFYEDIDLLYHIAQHEIENKYSHKCSKCDFSTSSEDLLSKHEAKFHYEPDRRCYICTKRFEKPSELAEHIKHHGVGPKSASSTFICDRCGEMHTDRAKHTRHMSRHREKDRQQPQSCKECGEVFVNARNLAKHMFKSHKDAGHHRLPSRYPCAYCNYVSLNRFDFRRHMSSHKKVKPFVCKICEKTFGNPKDLGRHVKFHKEGRFTKKFRCFACHIDRDTTRMKSHLQTEGHNLNCKLACIDVKDYNEDLWKVFPGKSEFQQYDAKTRFGMNFSDKCWKVHEKHRDRAAKLITEEKSYSVLTPEGAEIQIEMPSRNPKCEECGLMFKTTDNLEEHNEHVRLLNNASTRNEYTCKVCNIHLFDKIGVAKHATTEEHIEKCRSQEINPEDILIQNNITKETYSMRRKEFILKGFRCKVCDVYFAAKASKAIHNEKEIHVQKCRELGVDPAGDHFEDCNADKKKMEKPKKEKQSMISNRIEKAIKKKKLQYATIDLLGVQVPRNLAFTCLVCSVILQNRTQGIDHLNTPMHITNCVSKGIKSAACNLKVRASDIPGVVGKSISELLGIASDAVFPLSETEKAVYMRQIQESEMAKNESNLVYRVVKIKPQTGEPIVVSEEQPDCDLEIPQQPHTTTTSTSPYVTEVSFASEESPSESNSVLSGSTVSVDQRNAVSTSTVSLTSSTLNVSKDSEGNALRYQIILHPSNSQTQQTTGESESEMAVDQILLDDENVVEIYENPEFSDELDHFDPLIFDK